MIRQLIREQADLQSVQQWVVEKDYAISYLLKAISITNGLGAALVLKGGTALRKLYFRDYRFSEDLDYSTLEIGPVVDLDDKISRAVEIAEELLQSKGLLVSNLNISERANHIQVDNLHMSFGFNFLITASPYVGLK